MSALSRTCFVRFQAFSPLARFASISTERGDYLQPEFLKKFKGQVLSKEEIDKLSDHVKSFFPKQADGPMLYREVDLDVNRVPIWVNDVESFMHAEEVKADLSKRIWEEQGFNYLVFFGQFGVTKFRIPLQIIYNHFTQKLELKPHPKQYEQEFSKRHRANIDSIINTYRTKIYNTIIGGEFRFKRRLKLVGMGMKVASIIPHPKVPRQKVLEFQLGKSHIIPFAVPTNVHVKLLNKRGTGLRLYSADYEKLQSTTADIRKLKPPEVYTGKGIVYHGEVVKRKEGKKK